MEQRQVDRLDVLDAPPVEHEASQQGVEVELIASRVLAKEARYLLQQMKPRQIFSQDFIKTVAGKCQGAEM